MRIKKLICLVNNWSFVKNLLAITSKLHLSEILSSTLYRFMALKPSPDYHPPKHKRRKTEQRMYGYFMCGCCDKKWESSKVFVRDGTKETAYCQDCKTCHTPTLPYRVEALTCFTCGETECKCQIILAELDILCDCNCFWKKTEWILVVWTRGHHAIREYNDKCNKCGRIGNFAQYYYIIKEHKKRTIDKFKQHEQELCHRCKHRDNPCQ